MHTETNELALITRETLGDSWDASHKIDLFPEKTLHFGIGFLDDALGGIEYDEFTVIAARTGQGKSFMVQNIAMNAAMSGKRILYFALESTRVELGARLRFQMLSEHLIETYGYADFADWYKRKTPEKIVIDKPVWTDSIHIKYRDSRMGLAELNKHILAGSQEVDMVVIDHLHYLDLAGSNENEAISEVVKHIKQLNIEIGKAVILVSHVRKRNKSDYLIPGPPEVEDLHGSSEISKSANQVITFEAGTFDLNLYVDGSRSLKTIKSVSGTMIRVCKWRLDSSHSNYTAFVNFDIQRRRYSDKYRLLVVNRGDDYYSQMDFDKLPRWAKGAL